MKLLAMGSFLNLIWYIIQLPKKIDVTQPIAPSHFDWLNHLSASVECCVLMKVDLGRGRIKEADK